jgi:hypothetical protein
MSGLGVAAFRVLDKLSHAKPADQWASIGFMCGGILVASTIMWKSLASNVGA